MVKTMFKAKWTQLNQAIQVFSRRSDDTGSWSFPTGFSSWSLGTSGWMVFHGIK